MTVVLQSQQVPDRCVGPDEQRRQYAQQNAEHHMGRQADSQGHPAHFHTAETDGIQPDDMTTPKQARTYSYTSLRGATATGL